MELASKWRGAFVLLLIAGLSLLGCPQIGSTAGTWSVISLPQPPGEVLYPGPLAADAAGNLFVADARYGTSQIQKRDAQGNWSLIATWGIGLGQVNGPAALAVDGAGNLYVIDYGDDGTGKLGRIQKRDAQGHWSLVAGYGNALAQVDFINDCGMSCPFGDALAADAAGNLYVADRLVDFEGINSGRIQKRNARGNWSVVATQGARALAVDAAGNLYVGESYYDDGTAQYLFRIRKRDAQGNWFVIAPAGDTLGQADFDSDRALAVDASGNLYIEDTGNDGRGNSGRIQQRDARGNWSLVAGYGTALGQVTNPEGLAVDGAGKLYVADTGNHRVQMYTPSP